MLSSFRSGAFQGLDVLLVEVEVDTYLSNSEEDKYNMVLVGLPDTAVRESKDRVMTALRNAVGSLRGLRCTVNLAPGDLKKEGPLYDLPIAMGILSALKKIEYGKELNRFLIVGELGLSGETRPISGALALAIYAKENGYRGLILPAANAREASVVPGLEIIPIRHIKELESPLDELKIYSSEKDSKAVLDPAVVPEVDFADVSGHAHAKRAMEVVAAGGHNIVLSGPPGSGKTMLAKALVGILPPLAFQEALQTTKAHAVAGLLPVGANLLTRRPFRAPHHTVSYAGLIGGGSTPRPGEVALAHQGVLFLDELPEFSRTVLEVLRQPLEDRKVTISRANGNYTFPTDFICVAAMNPCPCGFLGHPEKSCRDSSLQISRYRGKISGPLWDRMDLMIEVPALTYDQMKTSGQRESSEVVRQRVIRAREAQKNRLGEGRTNAQMTTREMEKNVIFSEGCGPIMKLAIENGGFSMRVCERIKRVAVTISDLDDSRIVKEGHLLEALSMRNRLIESPALLFA